MPCSAKFSLSLQTIFLLTETSDFLKKKFSSHLKFCVIIEGSPTNTFFSVSVLQGFSFQGGVVGWCDGPG